MSTDLDRVIISTQLHTMHESKYDCWLITLLQPETLFTPHQGHPYRTLVRLELKYFSATWEP